jgi:hypothetical protein
MDTQTNHIQAGKYIKVAEWVGRVDDVATGGHIMILVSSPKQVYRHGPPEWLEFHPDTPDLIRPATADDWVAECARYMKRTQQDYQALFAMAEKTYEKTREE